MADGKLITGDEEKVLKQILNAEDKKLDREWLQKVCDCPQFSGCNYSKLRSNSCSGQEDPLCGEKSVFQLIRHVDEYSTLHYFGNLRHIKSMIA